MATDPRTSKDRIGGAFRRAASTYDTVIPFFRTFADHLVEAAAPGPGAQVLDVASGRGDWVVGVEPLRRWLRLPAPPSTPRLPLHLRGRQILGPPREPGDMIPASSLG